MRNALAMVVLTLSACGREQPTADFYVDGVGVKLETAATWAAAPDFPARFRSTVAASASMVGGTYANLRGWVVVFRDAPFDCEQDRNAFGCTDPDGWIAVAVATDCVESTALAHEVLHVIIGDRCHTDSRWRDFSEVASELKAEVPRGSACFPHQGAWTTGPTC